MFLAQSICFSSNDCVSRPINVFLTQSMCFCLCFCLPIIICSSYSRIIFASLSFSFLVTRLNGYAIPSNEQEWLAKHKNKQGNALYGTGARCTHCLRIGLFTRLSPVIQGMCCSHSLCVFVCVCVCPTVFLLVCVRIFICLSTSYLHISLCP